MAVSENPETRFTAGDCRFMARAIQLAWRGRFTAHPNPRVGCVIVRNDRIIGEGWHVRTGEAHAEINALAAVDGDARGATAYVTLEPCAHHGKTPPCAEALVAAGIREVIFSMQDPHPKVAGSGRQALLKAGIAVRSGLMAAEAARLNEGFLSRVTRRRPWLRLKIATSLDGCTAMSDGQSQWISGPEARTDVQRFRAASGAVLTGIGTVLADDPSLTVRDRSLASRQPGRVVLDSRLRMPRAAIMLTLPGETHVFCVDDGNRAVLEDAGASVHKCAGKNGEVDAAEVLGKLAEMEINDVFVEAGRVLSGSLLTSGLVDELVIYQAPHIMGSETRGMFDTPAWTGLQDRLELDYVDVRRFGRDTRIIARPVRRD
jgi:diaminohydroxyphosphoribosylaminopyrimidine deaminase / 5-amino-6-(5-phosphoribosylamino)uracil reductase